MPAQRFFKPAEVTAAIQQTMACYQKVALVVGPSGSGKSRLLRAIAQQMSIPQVNLGLELSTKLLSFTSRERKLMATDIIADILDAHGTTSLTVDNTEIIFDPALMLNTLGLLHTISRTRLLVWSWNGTAEDGYVSYATPGHPEHVRIPTQDMTLIVL